MLDINKKKKKFSISAVLSVLSLLENISSTNVTKEVDVFVIICMFIDHASGKI